MGDENINNLEELIQKYTGSNTKLIKSSISKLTLPGENYLGIVLKVEAVLMDEDGEEKKFSAVAKCLNFKLMDFIKQTIPAQYRKENAFYTEIVPTMEEFQRECALEEKGILGIFPKLYASRSSLNGSSDEIDENAVILLENLGEDGYANMDRITGFDFDGAKLILKDLAAFHATPIALKLKKPDVFEKKIKKHLGRVFGGSGTELPPPPPSATKPEDIWLEILSQYDEVKPYFEKLEKVLRAGNETFNEYCKKEANEPFATICHSDLWTNNTMQVISEGKPIKNKFVDFQLYLYSSVAADLIFFLWSSVQLPVIYEHFDDLVKFYHGNFVSYLDKFGCDITPFSFNKLLEEIDEYAPYEFHHIMFMLIPIYGKKGEAAFDATDSPYSLKKENISEEARNRAASLVAEFGQRNWL